MALTKEEIDALLSEHATLCSEPYAKTARRR
jgi:hypothetical protein